MNSSVDGGVDGDACGDGDDGAASADERAGVPHAREHDDADGGSSGLQQKSPRQWVSQQRYSLSLT